MDNAQQCRAKALLCRQQACLHPEENWKWLAQAERWEHLAETSFIPGSEPPRAEPTDAAAGESRKRARAESHYAVMSSSD